jgi:hypothetical protein
MDDREKQLQDLMKYFYKEMIQYDIAGDLIPSQWEAIIRTVSHFVLFFVPTLSVLNYAVDPVVGFAFDASSAIELCKKAQEFVDIVMSIHYLSKGE